MRRADHVNDRVTTGWCRLTVVLLAVWLYSIDRAEAAELDSALPMFNRDIRPILADQCFACHGPDKAARKADLRLDDREAALMQGAIVPGDAMASPLFERVTSTDSETRMPPESTHKTLTGEQIERLRRWIEAGANYEAHWAFLPVPQRVALPIITQNRAWVRQPLDRFIVQQHGERAMVPAREATREEWLRRVRFDLTGLPPTLAELDAFLADHSEQAYERVVDRLLHDPAFGERMANDWLDVARYADTFGYQADREMHMWPWRDWAIQVLNDNLPYDQFIIWQTAGDLLPAATAAQQIATGFNRLHRQTNEGGSIEEEFRTAYVADRVVTNGTAFLGLSLECARCHDHKFDPISQRDFYALAAFFAQIDEHGLYSHFTETAPTPALLLYGPGQAERHAELTQQIQSLEEKLDAAIATASSRFVANELPPVVPVMPSATFDFQDLMTTDDYRAVPGRVGTAIEFGGDGPYTCAKAGQWDRTTPFSFALWFKPSDHAARRVILHRSVAAEDASFRGYQLVLDQGRAQFSLIHFWPGNALRVATKDRIPVGEWTHLVVTYDGSSHAQGVHVYMNGREANVEVTRDQLTRDIVYRGDWGDSGSPELALGARFRDVGFAGGTIDELMTFDQELTAAEALSLAPDHGIIDRGIIALHAALRQDESVGSLRAELQTLRREENALVTGIRQLMTLQRAKQSRTVRVLRRGAYDAPTDEVTPDTPSRILPFRDEWSRDRLGLARWMTDERNPLVSRVGVNRFWQIFFGRGIVGSAADFGSQGQQPSHPELLDWLARDWMDHGWDVKRLCRMIVLSATYRQSSTPNDVAAYRDDPDNRWLARGPRHRWSAEQIRDQALAVSRLLTLQLGGPSVYPYQPAGLWEESGTGKTYVASTGSGLYRRSLYTFWRRTSPPPSMTTFDATSREVCTARREPTGTPLQALVLLNDPQYVEAARHIAQRVLRDAGPSLDDQIVMAMRLLTSRRPSSSEAEILKQLYREQQAHFANDQDQARALLKEGASPRDESIAVVDHAAMTVTIQALLSYDECVTKR